MPEIAATRGEVVADHAGDSPPHGGWFAPARILGATVRAPAVWLPALALLALTVVFRVSSADNALTQWFYAGGEPWDRWPLAVAQPWAALYTWGCYPGLILGVGGLAIWLISFAFPRLQPWRDAGLFFAVLLVVGPGVLINGLCKPCWERPRPHATVLFGGPREFVPVLDRGRGADDSSFPSGHAAMGFYLMAPAFVVYRRHRRLAATFVLFGLASGVVIGLARIVAGCHFASDVLWSAGIVYFAALILAAPFHFGRAPCAADSPAPPLRSPA
jgi:lipid A 4'-phosphatase